jgi:hypothetical protein
MMQQYQLVQSIIDNDDVCLYLIGQGDSHSTPIEIVGVSDALNTVINEILMNTSAESISELVDIKFTGNRTELCRQYLHTKCQVEIVILPCDVGVIDFLEAKNGEIQQ